MRPGSASVPSGLSLAGLLRGSGISRISWHQLEDMSATQMEVLCVKKLMLRSDVVVGAGLAASTAGVLLRQ